MDAAVTQNAKNEMSHLYTALVVIYPAFSAAAFIGPEHVVFADIVFI